MSFKPFIVLLLATVAFCPAVISADKSESETEAKKATEEFLSVIDAGRFGESWNMAGTYMQRAISAELWQRKLETMRKPLGELIWRKLKSSKLEKTTLEVPGPEYFKLQFETSFKNREHAIETVSAAKQADGTQKVIGYYIE